MPSMYRVHHKDLLESSQVAVQTDAGVMRVEARWDGGPAVGSFGRREWVLPGFRLIEFDADLRMPLAFNDPKPDSWIGTMYMMRGDLLSQMGTQRNVRMRKNELNFVFETCPDTDHIIDCRQDLHAFYVEVDPEFFRQLVIDYPDWMRVHGASLEHNKPFLGLQRGLPMSPAVHQLIQAVINCPYSGTLRKLFLEARFLDLFVEQQQLYQSAVQRQTGSKERELFQAIRQYLDEQYANPPTLVALARLFGLNDFKLKKGFREQFGTTVFGYIAEKRLTVARYLLEATETPVHEVGENVGFSNPAHFATAFRKKFGVAPSQVRRHGANGVGLPADVEVQARMVVSRPEAA